MWWLFGFLLVVTDAVTEDEAVLSRCAEIYGECGDAVGGPPDIDPRTEEEFRHSCQHFQCYQNYRNCIGDKDSNSLHVDYLSNNLRVCEEYSVIYSASTEDTDVGPGCIGRVIAECTNPDEEPKEVPGTEEEFQHLCKYSKSYFECAENILENCDEDDFYEETFRDFGSNIRRLCNENSLIYSALVESLPCIKKNIEEIFICERTLDSDSFVDTLAEVGVTDLNTRIHEPNRCMGVLHAFGCMSATAGKNCGNLARAVLVNVFQGLNSPYKVCPAGVKDYIPDIARVMQAEEKKREDVENKLKRKR